MHVIYSEFPLYNLSYLKFVVTCLLFITVNTDQENEKYEQHKAVTATNKTPQLCQFMPTKSVDDQVSKESCSNIPA
jgi:hypothetical protein